MGVTATLSAFAADIRLDALPPAVVNRARFLAPRPRRKHCPRPLRC